ncbi:MAG TPA: sulfotransferase [Candidatus Didemnitutus sp.]|nr:sulfotransferase [Candidatus Didemnitutus sp.]
MILSIHIPKTAGIRFRDLLRERFGAGLILHYYHITDATGQVLAGVPEAAECVHGTFRADALLKRFPQAQLITWVRDPVDRVISSYYHRLRGSDSAVDGVEPPRELSLAEYADHPLVRNEMTRFFGARRPADFLFVGIVERQERSLARLRRLFGHDFAPAAREEIVPDGNVPRFVIDAGIREEIERANAADMALYRECLVRDDRESRLEGGISPDISTVRVATAW